MRPILPRSNSYRYFLKEATLHCCEPTCLCLGPLFNIDCCDLWPWPMWPLTLIFVSRDMNFYPVNFYLMSYFLVIDGQTDRQKAMHKSPPCMTTGGLKKRKNPHCMCTRNCEQGKVITYHTSENYNSMMCKNHLHVQKCIFITLNRQNITIGHSSWSYRFQVLQK